MTIRIITVNIPESYIRAIKVLTGDGSLYPSRSELVRVAVREWIIKELESAKTFAEFQKQSPFTEKYPPKVEEEFEVNIDEILGFYPEKKDERMSAEIKYKTMTQQDFQKVPTMELPIEKSGSVVDLGKQLMIDGKVFNVK